jgi:hypothetical protein
MENDSSGDEWRVYYQNATTDIRFFKEQQWKVAYYVLLLNAALVAASHKLHFATDIMHFFVLLSVGATVWAICLLRSLYKAEERARCRMNQATSKFTICGQLVPPTDESRWAICALLGAVLIIACFITVCILVTPERNSQGFTLRHSQHRVVASIKSVELIQLVVS